MTFTVGSGIIEFPIHLFSGRFPSLPGSNEISYVVTMYAIISFIRYDAKWRPGLQEHGMSSKRHRRDSGHSPSMTPMPKRNVVDASTNEALRRRVFLLSRLDEPPWIEDCWIIVVLLVDMGGCRGRRKKDTGRDSDASRKSDRFQSFAPYSCCRFISWEFKFHASTDENPLELIPLSLWLSLRKLSIFWNLLTTPLPQSPPSEARTASTSSRMGTARDGSAAR